MPPPEFVGSLLGPHFCAKFIINILMFSSLAVKLFFAIVGVARSYFVQYDLYFNKLGAQININKY